MAQFCDLHTHSVFSDGSDTPAQIVDTAIAADLAAVALTDHDSVDGLPEFLAAAAGKPIEAIPGAEFAVTHDGTELHLLGLYIPPTAFSQISELMQQAQLRREACVFALVESLNRAGYSLDFDALKRSAQGQVTRAHVAVALEEKGYLSADVAFQTLLKPGAGHYQSPQRLPFLQVLELIRSVGAVPVLAHPFLNMTAEQLSAFLPFAKRQGLVGMECMYSAYDAATTAASFALAEAAGLLPSGGSDFHGDIRPEAPLGDQQVPYRFAQALQGSLHPEKTVI